MNFELEEDHRLLQDLAVSLWRDKAATRLVHKAEAVYTRNRTAAVQRYQELFQLHPDPLGDDFQQARKRLEGMEQYLLQLWRES